MPYLRLQPLLCFSQLLKKANEGPASPVSLRGQANLKNWIFMSTFFKFKTLCICIYIYKTKYIWLPIEDD